MFFHIARDVIDIAIEADPCVSHPVVPSQLLLRDDDGHGA